MFKRYIDFGFFTNPVGGYFKWLAKKSYYQLKNWGKHLRVSYKCMVISSHFGKYNWLGEYSFIVNCTLGDFTYCAGHCVINNAVIGKFCSIGPNVKIAPGKHPTSKYVSTHPSTFNNQPNFVKSFVSGNNYKSSAEVKIGNDVWIGANCVIVDGVTIGDGVIVAANSVVSKHVSAYEIVGGNPAKFIRKRFNDDEIDALLNIKWWDKDEDWIQCNIARFWSVGDFINFQKQF
jgi:chloramphenicol O-acetyltransferase type B